LRASPQGTLCFYSMSYDWSRGAENNDPKVGDERLAAAYLSLPSHPRFSALAPVSAQMGSNIYVHQIQQAEVAPKDPKAPKK
jgi:hypothetical protein